MIIRYLLAVLLFSLAQFSFPAFAGTYNACSPTAPVLPCTNAYNQDMDSLLSNGTIKAFYKSEAYTLSTIPDNPYNYKQLNVKSGYNHSDGQSFLWNGSSWQNFGAFGQATAEENPSFTSSIGVPYLPVPQSPVDGDIEFVNNDIYCSDLIWCFNQHQSGTHTTTGGISSSNDYYAWDVNLNYPSHNTDDGDPVYAVEAGTVTSPGSTGYAGATNAGGTYGQLLIQHNYNGLTWWSGYLHLENIQVSAGNTVSKGQLLGYISCTGLGGSPCTGDDHLHLVVYTGTNSSGDLISFDTTFTEK